MDDLRSQDFDLSVEESVRQGRILLEKAIRNITEGLFLQIERYSSKGSLSLVAVKYQGDKERFQKLAEFHFADACDALGPRQRIVVSVTR